MSDEWNAHEEEEDFGPDCGRWFDGRLSQSCSLAGTEFCDFECPYRSSLAPGCDAALRESR